MRNPFKRQAREVVEDKAVTFDGVTVDPALLYGEGYNLVTGTTWTPPLSPRVSRAEAMSVPAVKRVRDLICSLGSLRLRLIGPDNKPTEWSFFAQPENGVPGVVTWTNVAEDLLFEKVAWLKIRLVGWHNKPVDSVRLYPPTVTITPELRVWSSATGHGMSAGYIDDDQLIRIDSPNDALLRSGARAIRALIRLDQAALNLADGVPPVDYFTPQEGADPASDEKIIAVLNDWKLARREGGTAYVPAALKYNSGGFNPEQLQLVQAREFAITEIARLAGIDSEELGVSTTSRTYFNAFDRTQTFIQFTLRPYMRAIEQRLSMDDVTPRGYRAEFDLDDLFRADTLSRFQAYEVGKRAGAITGPEIRAAEGKPDLTPAEQAALAPAPTPTPEEATP